MDPVRGRGAAADLPNRFERLEVELDENEAARIPGERRTLALRDHSRSVLTRNRSPDVGFDWSLNPYRGCEHGCAYCYARPTHEYLGFSAGLDFESRIMVKEDAPELVEAELARPGWSAVPLVMSGVTDPYQPLERKLRVTRRCLEVLARARHPVAIITKSRLVERDVDLLATLAAHDAAHVTISITTLDRRLQRSLEPRASPPEHRIAAIRTLAEAGIPVAVNVAPIIPGLTDHEMPAILEAAGRAGATAAGYVSLRLPGAVRPIFLEWLDTHCPDRSGKVRSRLRSLHGGGLYDPAFGRRMRGSGPYADQIRSLFHAGRQRAGLGRRLIDLDVRHFRRPSRAPDGSVRSTPGPQLEIFVEERRDPGAEVDDILQNEDDDR
ncbi:MAG: PA0069 family radical SAM protein [Gemmatimonadota bacterium]